MGKRSSYEYGESHPNFKHGGKRRFRKEYMAWQNMKNRCLRKNCDKYSYYGGRGIKICDQWITDFNCFLKDVGVAPSPLHSLERRENDGHYQPHNVFWATKEVQMSNRRNNRWIEYDGKKMIMANWAKFFGIDNSNLLKMLKKYPFEYIYNFYNNKISTKSPTMKFALTQKELEYSPNK